MLASEYAHGIRFKPMTRYEEFHLSRRLFRLAGLVAAAFLVALVIGSTSTAAAALDAMDDGRVIAIDTAYPQGGSHHGHSGEHDHEASCSGYGQCSAAAIFCPSMVLAAPAEVLRRPFRPRICPGSGQSLIDRPPIC